MPLRIADGLTLTRVPLAAVFVVVARQPRWATAVLVVAGLTDVLDGWVARKRGEAHELGALLDGIVDKIFVLTVAIALVVQARLTKTEAVLLGVRDLGELLLIGVALLLPMRAVRRIGAEWLGKATTIAQFAAVLAAIHNVAERPLLCALAAGLGIATTFAHARRSLVDPGVRAAAIVKSSPSVVVYRGPEP